MRRLLIFALLAILIIGCSPQTQVENKTQEQVPIENDTSENSSINMIETPGNNITKLSISSGGDSLTIGRQGWVRAEMLRPAGGFEMRPMIQVYNIQKDAHSRLWTIVQSLDLKELKRLDSDNYTTTIDIEKTDERIIIKVSKETFNTLQPLVNLKNELIKVRDENKW